MAKDLSGLKVGGRDGARYSGKAYLGVTFRNQFTPEDMKDFADTLKEIIKNPEEKTADRLKALDLALKKLVADEVDDASMSNTIPTEKLMEMIKNAGFKLTPISIGE